MATVRTVVDIDVSDDPSDETLENLANEVRRYVNGTVTSLFYEGTEMTSAHSHNHVANSSYLCDQCRRFSKLQELEDALE